MLTFQEILSITEQLKFDKRLIMNCLPEEGFVVRDSAELKPQ